MAKAELESDDLGKVKIAFATVGFNGIYDQIASTFATAKTFTLVEVNGEKVRVEVISNPAASLERGRGRTVVQMLADKGINAVVASEFGPGASAFLRENKIEMILTKSGSKVVDVLRSKILKYDAFDPTSFK